MSNPRGSLERHLPPTPPTEDELLMLRIPCGNTMPRAAWRRQGIVVIRPADVRDEIIRQALVNEATRLYGQREIG
jgi:hypothetical protein